METNKFDLGPRWSSEELELFFDCKPIQILDVYLVYKA